MNLQEVKSENVRKMGSYISLGKAGLISFSKDATNNLKLVDGTKVMFLQDKDSPKDWYISVSEDADNSIRYYKEGLCGFNSSSINFRIKESVGLDAKTSIRVLLGTAFDHDGKSLVALITSKL